MRLKTQKAIQKRFLDTKPDNQTERLTFLPCIRLLFVIKSTDFEPEAPFNG